MARTGSAPTDRVIDVVELLSRPGGQRWRYSEIARELELTQATTHAILTTLCERGWVIRDPASKTFALGPGLAPVATAVKDRPFFEAARIAVTELAAEFGYAASVVEKLTDDALVITAFEGGDRLWPGGRIPYAPPFGASFAAWDSDDGRRAWLARSTADNATIARISDMLTRTRERGFDVDCTSPQLGQAAWLLHTLDGGAIALPLNIRETLDQLRAEFTTIGFPEPAATAVVQQVAAIAAPVLGPHRHAALLIAVHPLVPLTSDRIEAIGRHVARKAAAITDLAR
ncbi:helix-turn-helix domain-containing protein [Nocardia exalbida]|uniref:helix-turn-helix domain-containing protein n=1 Tax=Nocardia exalbida TaxID=290231 RepID=UPI0002D4E4C1|nr:helix-turn-helix domain-containing protein [Nocardia exalbida]